LEQRDKSKFEEEEPVKTSKFYAIFRKQLRVFLLNPEMLCLRKEKTISIRKAPFAFLKSRLTAM